MALGDVVIFEGVACPAARISERRPLEYKFVAMPGEDLPPATEPWSSLTLTTSGNGRPWSTHEPQGFWRDLSEVHPDQDEAVLRFARKWGDPAGKLMPSGETATAEWFGLAVGLRELAKGWEPIDQSGTSRFSSDPRNRLLARRWVRRLAALLPGEVDVVADPVPESALMRAEGGLVLRANTLRAYLVLSAAAAVKAQTPMRRCLACGAWFTFKRSTARYCGPSCRAIAHSGRQQGED
jgi:hypothetical protein